MSSRGKVEGGIYVPRRPPKKPGGEETDEVDTTIKMSQESTITFENITQTVTNLSKMRRCQILGVY